MKGAHLWFLVATAAVVACGTEFSSDTGGGATNSSSSGSGATGAGGTGLGAQGGGGSTTGSEDCLNGLDDDGDTLVDCADDDCADAGYQCIAVPEGWTGPVLVRAQQPGESCGGAWSEPTF